MEPEPNAFETTFAPLPPGVHPTGAEVSVDKALDPVVAYAPPPPSIASQPTRYVRVLHQTSGYPAGAVVAVDVFDDIDRLVRLEAVAYDRDATGPTPIDDTMATARKLAQPVMANQTIPRAPWVQASVADILGPAVYRAYVPRQLTGYSLVPAEHGQNLIIADRTPTASTYNEPTIPTQLDVGTEVILADPDLNRGKQ